MSTPVRDRAPRARRSCLLALLGLAVVLLSSCSGTSTPAKPKPSSSSSSAAPAPSGGIRTDGGSLAPTDAHLVPTTGVFVGSSAQPDTNTDAGRVAALDRLESAVGRRLDIVHTYLPWDKDFPSASDRTFLESGRRVLVSWNGMDMTEVASGRDDDLIRERARSMRDVGVPLWLMFRGEMDRPNLQDSVPSPEAYIQAYRHVRQIFTQEGADKVAWVWCPTSKGFDEGRAAAYYPGDDQVDWLCSDVYPGPDRVPFTTAAKAFVDWSRTHPQPLMVGEFGLSEGSGDRAAWLAAAATAIKAEPRIKAISYFNGNNDQKGPRAQLSLLGFPDSLLAFHDLLADPYFNPSHWPVQPPR